MRSLTTRLMVRAVCDEGGEIVAFVEQEHEHVVGGRVRRSRRGGGGASELDAGVLRDHELDVLRIVVLPGDEEDLLHPSGDHELAVDHRAEVARVEESVGRARRRSQGGVVVVARTDVRPANQDAADDAFRDRPALGVANAHFAVLHRPAEAHELDGAVGLRAAPADHVARAERVAREPLGA